MFTPSVSSTFFAARPAAQPIRFAGNPPADSYDVQRQNVLDGIQAQYGMVPAVLKNLATSPQAAQVYLDGQQTMQGARLTPQEQHVAQLVISKENGCGYCSVAHGFALKSTQMLAPAEVARLQAGEPLSDSRLQDLADLTRLLLAKKGGLSEAEKKQYQAKGFTEQHMVEIIALIGLKVLTNYTNHLLNTQVEPFMKG